MEYAPFLICAPTCHVMCHVHVVQGVLAANQLLPQTAMQLHCIGLFELPWT